MSNFSIGVSDASGVSGVSDASCAPKKDPAAGGSRVLGWDYS